MCYASLDDFYAFGLPPQALSNISLQDVQSMLVRVSAIVDTFLRDRYRLPLACPYDPALPVWVCQIAAYYLLSGPRGFNPNQGADMAVRDNFKDAMSSLTRIANGQQQLCVVQSQPESQQPQVATSPSRGWATPDGDDLPFVGPNSWGL